MNDIVDMNSGSMTTNSSEIAIVRTSPIWLRPLESPTLIALMVTLVICIWPVMRLLQARQQRDGVRAIQKLGGSVLYDFQRPKSGNPFHFDRLAPAQGPDWLRHLLGDEHFQEVVYVELRAKPVTDEDLKELKNFPYLENIELNHTRITGLGLVHLSELRNLKYLTFWKTQVDDEGLKHLALLENISRLGLDETRITDAGLVYLKGLTNLEVGLGLNHTAITDVGLEHLKDLKKLKQLSLRGTNVTDAGVRKLKLSLPQTEFLLDP